MNKMGKKLISLSLGVEIQSNTDAWFCMVQCGHQREALICLCKTKDDSEEIVEATDNVSVYGTESKRMIRKDKTNRTVCFPLRNSTLPS